MMQKREGGDLYLIKERANATNKRQEFRSSGVAELEGRDRSVPLNFSILQLLTSLKLDEVSSQIFHAFTRRVLWLLAPGS